MIVTNGSNTRPRQDADSEFMMIARIDQPSVRRRAGQDEDRQAAATRFFGDEGRFLRTYEIDTLEPTRGIAMEVEAGRATMGNGAHDVRYEIDRFADRYPLLVGLKA